jgi:hypothetical protein
MDRRGIAQLPVVRAGELVGIISRFELVAAMPQSGPGCALMRCPARLPKLVLIAAVVKSYDSPRNLTTPDPRDETRWYASFHHQTRKEWRGDFSD